MILQFHISDIAFMPNQVEACIIGLTTGGASIVGCDVVNMVGGN